MSTETSAITWTHVAPADEVWHAQIGVVRLAVWRTMRQRWGVQLWPFWNATTLPDSVAPDDLPGAKAAALKMAEDVLKPYADAYSIIAEERMR